jgi:response regulator RpfG family c-di-GMP phosphodiesterase
VRLLLVDDDESLRQLLRMTFESFDVLVDEAGSADAARERIAETKPDVIVLDVVMPGTDGLAFCRELKANGATRAIPVVLLSGTDNPAAAAKESGADSYLSKPFSPLEVLAVVERLAGGLYGVPFRAARKSDPEEQLLLYARDLRHLLELERGQRVLLQNAYHQTVSALASALEQKDSGTREHSQRVERYATVLARAIDPGLAADQSALYGFLLHDVGKIGVPDSVLLKPGPLTPSEWRQMQTHTVLGAQMLGDVVFLRGEGVRIVRSHHERWDGHGYPDGLGGEEIPLGARVFAVADTVDAMTSNRPYRRATSWDEARTEVLKGRGSQFDPDVVDVFRACERELREIKRELAA